MQDTVFDDNLLKSPLNNIKSLCSNAQASNKLYVFLQVYGAYRVILCHIYNIPLLYIVSYCKKQSSILNRE